MNKRFKIFTWCLFILYAAVLVKLILLKGSTEYLLSHFKNEYSLVLLEKKILAANLLPFATIYYYLSGQDSMETVPNIIGNIVLFIPLGFFLPMLFPHIRLLKQVTMIAFFTSLSFETIQLLIAYGSFDVDDCLLNSLGAMTGFFIFSVLSPRYLPSGGNQRKRN